MHNSTGSTGETCSIRIDTIVWHATGGNMLTCSMPHSTSFKLLPGVERQPASHGKLVLLKATKVRWSQEKAANFKESYRNSPNL